MIGLESLRRQTANAFCTYGRRVAEKEHCEATYHLIPAIMFTSAQLLFMLRDERFKCLCCFLAGYNDSSNYKTVQRLRNIPARIPIQRDSLEKRHCPQVVKARQCRNCSGKFVHRELGAGLVELRERILNCIENCVGVASFRFRDGLRLPSRSAFVYLRVLRISSERGSWLAVIVPREKHQSASSLTDQLRALQKPKEYFAGFLASELNKTALIPVPENGSATPARRPPLSATGFPSLVSRFPRGVFLCPESNFVANPFLQELRVLWFADCADEHGLVGAKPSEII